MSRPRRQAWLAALVGLAIVALAWPATVLAHSLNATYASRLPLAVYLAGAAATVALSFIFVLVRDVRATRPDPGRPEPCRRPPSASACVRPACWRGSGSWRRASSVAPATPTSRRCSCGSTAGSASASPSALIGPVWHFLDPFSTLHDLGAGLVRRLGMASWDTADVPGAPRSMAGGDRLRGRHLARARPPARAGRAVRRTRRLHAFTLAMMAQFGRDTWRAHGEIFTVWFRLLGRLAPYALVDEDGRVRRRPFATGLLEPGWSTRRRRHRRPRRRVDPVRRALADADLVRPVRAAGDRDARRPSWPASWRSSRSRAWP